MDIASKILEKAAKEANKYKPVTVNKHLDLKYDLGALLVIDRNEFNTQLTSHNKNDDLLNLARDNTQLLLNKVWELPTERVEEAVVVKLPSMKTVLPRMKQVPRPKPLTKWQKFAQEKGIQKKKKSKLTWDQQLQKWIPLYGFKRAKVQKDKYWLLEVPENEDPMKDQFAKIIQSKSENIAKNELQRLRNIARARKVKIPTVGITNPEVSAKHLQTAVAVARTSTSNLGKFQNKLPKEKEPRNITSISPGVTRKRKLPPVSANVEKNENLAIAETVLNKKPKLEIKEPIVKHVQNDQLKKTQKNRNKGSQSRKTKNGTDSKELKRLNRRRGEKRGKNSKQ